MALKLLVLMNQLLLVPLDQVDHLDQLVHLDLLEPDAGSV